ncbi:hypothetical protein EV174_007064, partial [Coemansia sp. RSA 2320]
DVARLVCERTAKHAGLSDRKGRIAIGLDADFVVWDPEENNRIDAEKLHFRNKLTPYHERTCQGLIHRTIVRGTAVYDISQINDNDTWESGFSRVAHGQWLDSAISRRD